MAKMDPVVHFEMPYEDKQRMSDFYTKAFGWQMNMLGPDMGDYVVVATGETDENHMLKEPGMINGGFFKKTKPEQGTSLVVAVDDIKESMKKVTNAGGKIIGSSKGMEEPDEIPGVGLYMAAQDSEGNRISLLQPKPMAAAGTK